ncbi:MAG: hypothetical protein JWO25_2807 [Alphaproteobacteria bacterium]|nr:hypothetical protein [Alphaproteobacteria bacterium]
MAADRNITGDHLLSPAYHSCIGPSPGNSEIGQCLETEVERQEGALNEAYRLVMAHLTPPRREALRASERQWIKERKRACDLAYKEMEGGTGDGIAHDICTASRAILRTRWIEHFR